MSDANVEQLTKELKDLQFTLAEMTIESEQLKARVKKLATRQPQWPKGYRPYNKKHGDHQQHGNWKNRPNDRHSN